jgi:hypothetical protein
MISAQAMSTIEGSEIYYDPVKYDGGSQGAVDAQKAFRNAEAVKFGRGTSYVVLTTEEGAKTIADYCQTVGETFAGETEAKTKRDGRVLLTAARRILFQMEKQRGQG